VNAGTASLGELSRLPTGAYQYKRLDGVVEYFDSRGGLQKLVHRSGAEQNVVQSGLWGGLTKITVTHSSTNQTIEIRYGTVKSRYGDGTVVANFRAQESLVDFVAPSGEKTQFGSRTQHYYMGPFAEAPNIYSIGTYTIGQSIPDTIAPPSSYYSGGMAPVGFHIGVHLPKLAYILWPNGDRTHFFYASGCPSCAAPADFKYPRKFWALHTSLAGVAEVGADNIVRHKAHYPFKTVNYYGYDVASVRSIHGQNDISLEDRVDDASGHGRTWTKASGHAKLFTVHKAGLEMRITQAYGAAFPGGGCFAAESQQMSFDSLGRYDVVTVNGKSIDYDYYTDDDFSKVGLLDKVTYVDADKVSGVLVDRVIDYDWTATGPGDERLLKRIVAPERSKEFEYEFGRIRRIIETDTSNDPSGYARVHGRTRQWENTYTYHGGDADGLHRVATIENIGPGGEHWTYVYNATGDLISVTNGLGHTFAYSGHNEFGFPVAMEDANGIVSTLDYDTRGRLTGVSTDGQSTIFEYQADGKLAKVTFADSTYLQYEYSDGGRLTVVRNGDGERIEIDRSRHASGYEDVTTLIYGATGTLRSQVAARYNALGQLWKMYDLGGVAADAVLKETIYDADGNPKSVNDAAGTVQHLFDNLGRLEKSTDQRDRNSVVTIGYDTQDNVTSVRDPEGVETTYHYDGFGNLLQESNPNTGTTTYYYDDAGNVIEKVTADAKRVAYTYDELNRLKTIDYPTQADVTFEYDATLTGGVTNYGIGRMTGVRTAYGQQINWVYDKFGNVIRDIRTIDGQTYTTSYSYDGTSKLTAIGYPGGRMVDLVRTGGRITQVNVNGTGISLAGSITYEPFGPVKAFTYFNGINFTESLDGHYRTDSLSADSVINLDYGYDNRSLVDSVVDLAGGPRGQDVQYHGAGRLAWASGDYGTDSYSYDRVGNRTALTRQLGSGSYSESYAYEPGTHRLAGISGSGAGAQNRAMDYSSVGSLETDTGRTFDYNDNGRLIAVHAGGTEIGRYGYNPLGERERKTAGGETRHFVYGRNGELLYEGAADRSWYREYIYLEGRLIAIAGDGGVGDQSQYHAVHTDRLGTPQVVTNSGKSVVWSAVYEPFGKVRLLAASFENNIRFPGQYYDQETGLHYNYFRDYDPATGRYIESDPIGLKGGFNTYAYVLNNPIMWIDPFGLKPPKDIPPNVDIPANVQEASNMNVMEFYNAVRNGGKWDFKQLDPKYQDYGNYHYGMMARAHGMSETMACRGAGWAQEQAGTSDPSWGDWTDMSSGSSYGDDPNDQKWIKEGMQDYNSQYFYPNIPSFNDGPAP
jgi:RHS repeat-associated protein